MTSAAMNDAPVTHNSKLLDVAAPIFDAPLAALFDQREAIDVAIKAVKALRDPPHALLDKARGTRLASGDALVFWNAMIDEITKP